jgi:uncharacterized membrane protein YbaN (DUF454 family)
MDGQPNDGQNNSRDGAGWLRQAAGWGLLLAGIAGCVLPILPGFPLLIAGLLILARDYVWAKRAVGKARRWAVKIRRKARARKASQAQANDVRRKRAEEV